MNKRILIFGDTHITLHNEFSRPTEDGLTTYLRECLDTFRWLAGVVADIRPTDVICMGDVFDSTGSVDTRSLVVGARCFRMVQEAGKRAGATLHMLVGNHDLYDPRNLLHNLEWMSEWHVYDQPRVQNEMIFLPWTQDAKLVTDFLQRAPGFPIFSHLEIEGSLRNVLGSPPEDKGIKLSALSGRVVFNGHYHTPHYINTAASLGFVMSVGSTNSRSFGDVDSPPRGAVFVTVDPARDRAVHWERIDNPFQRFYRDIHLDAIQAFQTPDPKRTVARVYYRAGQEDVAQEFVKQIEDARLIQVGSEMVAREESLSPVNIPIKNLQAFLELHISDISGPEQYAALDSYATWLVGQVSSEQFPQHIDFHWLKLRNFMSVAEANIVYGKGLILVEGENLDDPTMASNGSGKSVITVEALHWLLTGFTLRKLPVDEVVKEGENECLVECGMQIGPDHYVITRTRVNSGKGAGAGLKIEKNGVPIEVRKGKDTEGKLQDVLRLSPTRLFQTILLTADLQSRFSQLGPTDRLRVVEEMAGSTIYDELRAICKKDTDARDRLAQELRFRVEGILHTIQNAAAEVEALEVEVQAAEAESSQVIARLDAEAAQLQKQDEALRAELREAQKALDVEKGDGIGVLDTKLTLLRAAMEEAQMKARNVSAEIIALQTEREKLRSWNDLKVCPTCGQPTGRDICADRLAKVDAKLASITDMAGKVEAELALVTQKHDQLLEFRAQYQGRVRERAAHVAELTARLENVTRALQQNLDAWKLAEGQVDRLRGALARQREAITRLQIQVEQATKDRDKADQDLKVAQWWLSALGTTGIRAFINEQALKVLNDHLKVYSSRILGPELGTIYLTSYRETQTGGVSNKIDIKLSGGRSFAKLSSGQRRRVDLAIQFALNDLAGASSGAGANLLICDEILDPIDELGCRGVVEVLREKVAKLQVYLTTHNAALKALQFDGRMLVRLQGGTSRILEAQ